MVKDKFSALWLSYSSISDFLSCPKAYYYANIYKNPRTGRKIAIINPPLALGHVVHSVLDMLSTLPVEKRFIKPLEQRLHTEWEKISGEKGGFRNPEEEENFKQRGLEMIKKISINPGQIAKKAVKIKEDYHKAWYNMGIAYADKNDYDEAINCYKKAVKFGIVRINKKKYFMK